MLVLGIAGTLFLTAVAGAVFYVVRSPHSMPASANASTDDSQQEDALRSQPGAAEANAGGASPAASANDTSQARSIRDVNPSAPPADSDPSKRPLVATRATTEQPPQVPSPFADIVARNNQLVLPLRDVGLGASAIPAELTKLYIKSAKDAQLVLLGGDRIVRRGQQFAMTLKSADDAIANWAITAKSAISAGEPPEIGTFQIKDRTVFYSWDKDAPYSRWYDNLRYCRLRMTVANETIVCLLAKPAEVKPLSLDLSIRGVREELPMLEETCSPDPDLLRFNLQLQGFPPHKVSSASGLKLTDVATIQILPPGGEQDKFIEIEVRIIEDKGQRGIVCRAFTHAKVMRADGTTYGERRDTIRADMEGLRAKSRTPRRKLVADEKRHQRVIAQRMSAVEAQRRQLANVRAAYNIAQLSERTSLRSAMNAAEKMLEQAQAELNQTKSAKASMDQQLTFLDSHDKWCDDVLKTFKDLQEKGKIHFQVYFEADGQRIEILRTRISA